MKYMWQQNDFSYSYHRAQNPNTFWWHTINLSSKKLGKQVTACYVPLLILPCSHSCVICRHTCPLHLLFISAFVISVYRPNSRLIFATLMQELVANLIVWVVLKIPNPFESFSGFKDMRTPPAFLPLFIPILAMPYNTKRWALVVIKKDWRSLAEPKLSRTLGRLLSIKSWSSAFHFI